MRQLKITQQITNRDSQSLNKYFSEVNAVPMISAEEEARLAKLAREGDLKATEKLVTSNLRFVVSVAKQYQNTGELLGDLISVGNLGLMEAAKRFDETKGFKFISYAVWWIRQSIVQYISDNNKTIRLPSNKILQAGRLKRISSELEQFLERKPALFEITEEYAKKHKESISEISVCELLQFSLNPNSLDAKVSSDEDAGTLLDLIAGEGLDKINYTSNQEALRLTISHVSQKLSKVERYVLLSFYGINCKEKSLLEISEDLKLGKERVRQIKEKCLRKLRSNSSKNLLKEFL